MKHAARPLVIRSFAKLNLYLQVLNKRQDGFHNLSTLFARIDLADTIIFRNRKDGLIKIKSASSNLPKDKTNLCYRAAALLKQELKLSSGIEIEIKKHIPVGAGLGGGSSNAASVLLGLNKFWNLNLSRTRLAKLGAKLGSDVPFFIYQEKFALGSQRGDKIKPVGTLKKLKLWFVLVNPGFGVSTPLIYRKFGLFLAEKSRFSRLTMPCRNVKILTSELLKKGKAVDPQYFFNSLEAVTGKLYPAVNQIKDSLCRLGLSRVMMSGSGPTVFALCDCRLQAQSLSSRLRKQHRTWQIFVASTV